MAVKLPLRTFIKFLLFAMLAAVLLFFAFRGVNFEELAIGFRNAKYLWVILSVLVGFASHIFRSLRWQMLMEPLGPKPSLWSTLSALMVGYLANLAFPRMGEITRCLSLRKTNGLPFESLVGTVIVERALDVLVMMILFATVFFVRINFFGQFLWIDVVVPLGAKIKGLISISPIVPLAAAFGVVVGLVLIRRNVFGKRLKQKMRALFWGVVDGLKSVIKTKQRKAFTIYTVLIWVCYWLMTWLIFFSISATSHLSAIDGLFILVVGSLGMAAPVQGGFGAFHIIVAMALGIYGISWEEGLIYATISHGSQTLLVIFAGVTFLIVLFFQKKRGNLPQETKHTA